MPSSPPKEAALLRQLEQLGRLYHGHGETFKGQAFQRLAAIVKERGVEGALRYLPKTSKASIAVLQEYKRTGRIKRLAEMKKSYYNIHDARLAPRGRCSSARTYPRKSPRKSKRKSPKKSQRKSPKKPPKKTQKGNT